MPGVWPEAKPGENVRSNEARFAVWTEFDLESAVWTIPAEHMEAVKPTS